MPEAVADPPQLYRILKNPKTLPIVTQVANQTIAVRIPEQGKSLLETMQQRLDRTRLAIERRFPNYPPGRLEAMFDFMFGFMRLEPESLTSNKIESPYQKEISARVQHNLVHQIVYAHNPKADPNYVDNVYTTVTNIIKQAEKFRTVQSTQLDSCWEGTRNELAVVNALLENGYQVFVPDYTQDTGEIRDEEDEVLQLDIKRGIDLITISPEGKIILIDVKGRRIPEAILENDQIINLSDKTHPAVKKAIQRAASGRVIDPPQIYQTTLIFPSEGQSFKPSTLHSLNTTLEERKKALASFGNLQPHVEVGIIEQLRQLQKPLRTSLLKTRQLI